MTGNQIKYWELQERKRSNRQTEMETGRHNRATENVESGKLQNAINTLAETSTHNRAMEQQAINELNESNRHNVATELESGRHNRATEMQAINDLAERARSNIANEINVRAQIAETAQHNRNSEAESVRHNQATERTQNVANLLTEQRDRYNYDIGSRTASTAEDRARIALQEYLLKEGLNDKQIQNIDAETSKIISDESLNTYRKAQLIAQAVRDMSGVGKNVTDIINILK